MLDIVSWFEESDVDVAGIGVAGRSGVTLACLPQAAILTSLPLTTFFTLCSEVHRQCYSGKEVRFASQNAYHECCNRCDSALLTTFRTLALHTHKNASILEHSTPSFALLGSRPRAMTAAAFLAHIEAVFCSGSRMILDHQRDTNT